jgi:endonuclease/exonuclease/phosphatase family metal-dependent hydrolase
VRVRDAVLAVACVVLLAPALALTLCRLTDPSWGRAVQAVAFTPLGLPLYAAALLLLAMVMVVRRTVAVPYALPAAVAAAGLVLHALWFSPQVTGDVPEPAAGAEPVVVMTANVLRGRGDGTELVEQAREHGVDLLAVTEITASSLAEMEEAGLTELLPHREGRPGVDGDVAGTMVFSNEPTALVDVLDTRLGALVVDTAGLRLMAVHPMAPPWPDLWRSDHATILDAVEERDPDLVAGDFNATPDHAPMRALDDAGYRSSVDLTNGGWQPTWPVNGMFGLVGFVGPTAQIDHVLVSDHWAVTESLTTELDGSDHKPVVAVVARR